MMKFLSRFGRGGAFSSDSSDGIFPLFLVLVLGMGFGCMASSPIIWDGYVSMNALGRLLIEGGFFLTLLFMSTSWLGFVLVPLLSFIRGFLMAAFCASSTFYSGLGIIGLLTKAALPTLIMLPAFFLVAEDCRCISSSLFKLRLGRGRGFGSAPLFFHLGFTIFCFFFYFIYHAYIF